MNYIIIRTCLRDDFLARLCYESFKYHNIDGDYIFLAEEGDGYANITETGEPIIYRHKYDNYGGLNGAQGVIETLRLANITPADDDRVILSDSDIVIYHNFIDEIPSDIEHAGVGGVKKGMMAFSGQLNIYSGRVYNYLITLSKEYIDKTHTGPVSFWGDIADDLYVSYITHKMDVKKLNLISKGYWRHHKYYEYKDRRDYKQLITEINADHTGNFNQ